MRASQWGDSYSDSPSGICRNKESLRKKRQIQFNALGKLSDDDFFVNAHCQKVSDEVNKKNGVQCQINSKAINVEVVETDSIKPHWKIMEKNT